MKFLKNTIVLSFFLLTFIIFTKVNGYTVKADALITNNNTTVVRTANLVTKKVIVVSKGASNNGRGGNSSLSRGGGRSDIVSYAARFMGKPYVWGASGPSAFDCSGFTAYVYKAFGVAMDHYTGSQYGMGSSVAKKDLKEGDLVFFNTYSSVSHVGIYIGGGQFIHASSGSNKVTVSNLSASYYTQRYAGARRILN